MRDLDLKSLRLLVAVCEHQNIKRAALAENIEPSAISKRIAALEAALGTPVLLRSRRGVLPTPMGQALLEHARSILFTLEQVHADVAAFSGGIRGHVRLLASASAVAESLLDDVAAFMRHPANRDIKVDIEERLSRDVVRGVRDGTAAIGVCWDSVDLMGLAQRAYRDDQLAMAVHVSHPLARRKTVSFEQTLDFEHVGLPPSTAVYTMLQRAAARVGRHLSYRVVVSNFDAALRVVAADLGISVIPQQVGLAHAASGAIKVVPLSNSWARRRFALCFVQGGQLSAAAAGLVEHLAGMAGRPR
jgi:DNA-binding transcriptional LysR family regulator